MPYRYQRSGQFGVRSSNNVYKWTFSGNDDNGGLRRQLTRVENLNDNVTELGDRCFYGCSRLNSVDIEASNVGKIGVQCFKGCSALKSATLPAALKEIPSQTFQGCERLESVDFGRMSKDDPDGNAERLESIGQDAFDGCGALEQLTLPATFTSVRSAADKLHPAALYGSGIKQLQFLGVSQVDLQEIKSAVKETYCYGLAHDCMIYLADDSAYSYVYVSGSLTSAQGFQLPSGSVAEGRLPVEQGGKTVYKMRLGKIYRFTAQIADWCRSEKVPFIVVYIDHMTSSASKAFCSGVLGDSAMIKRMCGEDGFKFYMLLLDRKGRLGRGADQDVDKYRDMYGTGGKFVQLTFEYNGNVQQTRLEGTSSDVFFQSVKAVAQSMGFQNWDWSKYEVKFDQVEDEAVPTGAVDTQLITALGFTPWWYPNVN